MLNHIDPYFLSVIREYFYTILFFLFENDDNNNDNIVIELNIFFHRYNKYLNILKNIHKPRVITEKKNHLSGQMHGMIQQVPVGLMVPSGLNPGLEIRTDYRLFLGSEISNKKRIR